MNVPWSDQSSLQRLRPRLWRFLRTHGRIHDIGAFAEELFHLPTKSFDRLISTHLSVSDEAGRALVALDYLIPRLPSTASRKEVELAGFVEGPVDWGRTIQRQIATGDDTLFVCKPTYRRYDSSAARLCAQGVSALIRVAGSSGLSTGGAVGREIEARGDAARRLGRHPKLSGMRLSYGAREVPERVFRRWPILRDVAIFNELVVEALDRRSPEVAWRVLSQKLLAPARADDLFELEVAFEVVDCLERYGFRHESGSSLISDEATNMPLVTLRSPNLGIVRVWWDRAFWQVAQSNSGTGTFKSVLQAAGMTLSSLRPDLILDFRDQGRHVLVEVKATGGDGVAAERRGIVEAFAYLYDAQERFASQAHPHALVVAWNATGSPALNPVMVANQNDIERAVTLILSTLPTALKATRSAFS